MRQIVLDIATIREIPLVSILPNKTVEQCLARRTLRCYSFHRNELVHLEGEPCDAVDIVVSGILAVQQMDEEGNMFSVASFEKHCIAGGNIAFSSKPFYPHSIVSPGECRIVRIDSGTIFHFCVAYPEFLRLFLKTASDNTMLVNEKLAAIMHRSLRQRLVAYLKAESVRQQTTSIVLPVTKTHLAHIIGVQRTSISRELARMRKEGLLLCEKKMITLDRKFFNRY